MASSFLEKMIISIKFYNLPNISFFLCQETRADQLKKQGKPAAMDQVKY